MILQNIGFKSNVQSVPIVSGRPYRRKVVFPPPPPSHPSHSEKSRLFQLLLEQFKENHFEGSNIEERFVFYSFYFLLLTNNFTCN